MKKLFVVAFAAFMLILTGCSNTESKPETDTSKLNAVEKFVIDTYKENGKNVAIEDVVLVDDIQNPNVKIANVKDFNKSGSMIFSKLVFTWDEAKETGVVSYLMVEDKVIIKTGE